MKKRRQVNKQATKHFAKKCYFCPCDTYALLDLHRIIEGGEYSNRNTVTVCANCHRRIHAKEIVIDRKFLCTNAKWVLHFWDESGEHYS